MRKVILLLVAAVMAVAFGPSFAQVNLAEKAVPGQVVVAAELESTPEEFSKNLTGEVVSVDKGRRTMNVPPSGVHSEGG